jgi:hypothetical protein
MAKNKRPKWLDAETPELLETLKGILAAEEITDKDQAKATKIVDELISRLPSEDAAPLSVAEAIAAAKACMDAALDGVKAAYDNEVATIADTEAEEEAEEEEEAPAPAPAPKKKDKKSKKGKKAAKVEEPEDEEESEDDEDSEEEEEDDSAEDYSDWSTKDLKKECRERGIKVTKSMGKAELVKALEADDKE